MPRRVGEAGRLRVVNLTVVTGPAVSKQRGRLASWARQGLCGSTMASR
jgi:hypothetical protein